MAVVPEMSGPTVCSRIPKGHIFNCEGVSALRHSKPNSSRLSIILKPPSDKFSIPANGLPQQENLMPLMDLLLLVQEVFDCINPFRASR